MSTLAENWTTEGGKLGFEKGLEEGRLQGFKEGFAEGFKEGFKEGRLEGMQEASANITLAQLERKLGKVSAAARRRIVRLPADTLQELSLALLDFTTSKDLAAWLSKHG